MIATLTALSAYYIGRADLRRCAEVGELLRVGVAGRRSFDPLIQGMNGVGALLRGEFEVARPELEKASVDWADDEEITSVWFVAEDPQAALWQHLAWDRLIQGDVVGADAATEQAVDRADRLGFPQGPYTKAWNRFVESCIWVEAGQLDRADELLADLMEAAEQYGFDLTLLMGSTLQAAVDALRLLDGKGDNPALLERTQAVTELVGVWRGTEMNLYITFLDCIVGRLLTAVGELNRARDWLDTGLEFARESGMHFYDAELLRLRAHTHTDPAAVQTDLQEALALARRQGGHLFELRAALDDLELRGDIARPAVAAAVSRMPTEIPMPELARAKDALRYT